MRIYSMTATFGKLAHETMLLEPGLNIIQAPNEWGKSTWCAFLVDMLYGIDTGARSTKTTLADKERYASWSGEPMSGSIDLCWQGRDITIQRRSKGRTVFGDFHAYETATGLPVPELTAANCGQVLLGVERSVFVRAGFLKLEDLPVTQDESLRRRLNDLVTTGDESGAHDTLAQTLKELKNRCRFNKTGLLPEAMAQRDGLVRKLEQLEALQEQSRRIQSRQEELEKHIARLENHRDTLAWETSREDQKRVETAQAAAGAAARQLAQLENACQILPPQEQVERQLGQLQQLQEKWSSMELEERMLPQMPQRPEARVPFQGMQPEKAVDMARTDAQRYEGLKKGSMLPYWLLLAAGAAVGIALSLWMPTLWPAGLLLPVPALGVLIWKQAGHNRNHREAGQLALKYGTADPAAWLDQAQSYASAQNTYQQALAAFENARGNFDSRRQTLRRELDLLTQGRSAHDCQVNWIRTRDTWVDCANARRECQRALEHAQTVKAMVKQAHRPELPDDMTFSGAETARLLSDSAYEYRQLQLKLGQCQGQMENLGQEAQLRQQLEAIRSRIQRLEDTYEALIIAQDTLAEARAALQRRFAPRISQRTQAIFAELTGGRYNRLTLEQDFSLQTGAQREDTLHTSLWRSAGTVDQLYFALRLAVAEELTPQAPLILDDALVRFDDDRLEAALQILEESAASRQVLLFTCQSREKAVQAKKK